MLVADDRADVVLLDLGLPDLDGIEVLRRRAFVQRRARRRAHRTRSPARTRSSALDAGADDYVTKPFDTEELLARVRAVLRRVPQASSTPAVVQRRRPRDRSRPPAGAPRRRAGAPHQDRARAARAARHPARQAAHPRVPAAQVWGRGYGIGEQLPARLRGPAAQASSATTPPTRASSSPNPASATAGSAATIEPSSGPRILSRRRPIKPSRSSRTPTGTGSGTRRSRRSGCGSCSCSTTCSRLLEPDPSYARFLLDGQTAVVDDYLEVRPEARAALRASPRAGGSQVGPWMILMDEFMVSGETIVRDLQLGIARGAEFGGAMRGRLPARHVRPRRADAADPAPRRARARGGVARRAAARSTQTAFWWDAPDGSHGARRVPLRLVLQRARPPRRRRSSSSPAPAATTPSSARPRSPAATCC